MVEERLEAAVIGGPKLTVTRDYRDNTRYWDIRHSQRSRSTTSTIR
jgi:hypothetical protein